MTAGLSTTVANAALATIVGTDLLYAQLHTGDPGTAGTTAVSTVTTREAVTWGSASGGVISSSGTAPEWTSWAGTSPETETYISLWSIVTAGSGTFGCSMALSASVTMNTGDSLTLTALFDNNFDRHIVTIPTASFFSPPSLPSGGFSLPERRLP